MANRVRQDEIQLKLVINGKEVKNTINDLNKSYQQLNREIRNLTPGSKEFIDKSKEITRVKTMLDDARKAAAQYNQEVGRAGKGMGDLSALATKMAGPLMAVFAGLQVGKIIGDLAETAVAMEAFQGKAKTVFGEAIGAVEAYAEANAAAMGMTRQEYITAATNTADLLIPMGFLRDEAAKLSTDMVNLSGALSEWSGGQRSATEVSEILQKALLGERESLKSLGVSISEAEVQTVLLEKGQQKLTGSALQQAKAMATLELVYAKSTDAQTAFAEGADSMGRKQAIIQAQLKSIGETMATLLVPAIQKALEVASKFVNGLTAVSNAFTKLVNPAKGLSAEFFDQKNKVQALEAELPALLTRYDELKGKSELNKDEQKELGDVIKRVGELTPGAVTEIDKYGNVLGINTQKSREFLEAEKARMAFTNKEAIGALEKEIKLLQGKLEAEMRIANNQRVATGFNRGTGGINTRDATPRELEEARRAVQNLANEIKGAQEQLKVLRGEARETQAVVNDGETEEQRKARLKREQEEREARLKAWQAAEKARLDALKKAAEAEAKAREEAERMLTQLTVDVMAEGLEKEIAQLRLRETQRISTVVGSEEQRRQQIILIEQQTEREVLKLREKYNADEIERITKEAETRISALTGTSEQILQARLQIEQETQLKLREVIERSSQEQVTSARETAKLRREALTIESEETAREILRIERETQEQITAIRTDDTLSEETKTARIRQTLEVEMERKAVVISQAGEVAEQLLAIEQKLSEELGATYTLRAQRIEAIETERIERTQQSDERIFKERIERLKEQAEREALELYQSTERKLAEALLIEDQSAQADAIEAIQEELKDRLLDGEIKFQQQRIEIMREAGLEVVSEETRLAELQIKLIEAKAKKATQIERDAAAERRKLIDDEFQTQSGYYEQTASMALEFSERISTTTIANLEARKQRELEIAGSNEEKRLEIEKRYNELRLTEEKRAKERAKPIAIAQIIINTAQAVSKMWAEAGPAAPILIPLAIASGAAQVATVIKQKFRRGGFTGTAPVAVQPDETGAKPVGVVHEREWVASREMVEDPVTGPLIQQLEQERRQRFGATVSPAKAPALSPPRSAAEIMSLKAYASGGYVSNSTLPSNTAVSATRTDTSNDQMIAEMRAMREAWNNIQFVTVWGEREADINTTINRRLSDRRSKEQLQ